ARHGAVRAVVGGGARRAGRRRARRPHPQHPRARTPRADGVPLRRPRRDADDPPRHVDARVVHARRPARGAPPPGADRPDVRPGAPPLSEEPRRLRALASLRLVLVTDRAACRGGLAEAVTRALAGGVTAVMIREKDLGHDELVRLAAPVVTACRKAGALVLVNGDAAAARDL